MDLVLIRSETRKAVRKELGHLAGILSAEHREPAGELMDLVSRIDILDPDEFHAMAWEYRDERVVLRDTIKQASLQ